MPCSLNILFVIRSTLGSLTPGRVWWTRLFFYDQLNTFFCGTGGDAALAAETTIAMRLEECFQTLRNGLMVVVIDLQEGDDPQVIFETLNARGEPLLPADLLKNYIFLRASKIRPKEHRGALRKVSGSD